MNYQLLSIFGSSGFFESLEVNASILVFTVNDFPSILLVRQYYHTQHLSLVKVNVLSSVDVVNPFYLLVDPT